MEANYKPDGIPSCIYILDGRERGREGVVSQCIHEVQDCEASFYWFPTNTLHWPQTLTCMHREWSVVGGVPPRAARTGQMEPPIMDSQKSRQPPYNGQTVHPLPILLKKGQPLNN